MLYIVPRKTQLYMLKKTQLYILRKTQLYILRRADKHDVNAGRLGFSPGSSLGGFSPRVSSSHSLSGRTSFGSSSTGYGSLSSGHRIGTSPTGILSSQTSHQHNKATSTSILYVSGAGKSPSQRGGAGAPPPHDNDGAGAPPRYGNAGAPPRYGNAGASPRYGNAGAPPPYGNAGLPPRYGNAGPPPQYGNAVGTTNNMEGPPVVSPNGFSAGNIVNHQGSADQGTIVYSPQYKVSDNDLLMLTEELFAKQEVNISKYLTLHLQSKSENVTDASKGPLIYTQQEVYDYPTILVIRALYDSYEHNSTVKENRTLEKRKKEDLLLDVFLNTNVLTRAMQWLSERGFIDPDDFERRNILRHIWFSQFDGATSGFERVFASKRYGAGLLGVQDWIYFDYQESKGRIDYMGYVDILKLGDKASLLKLNFKMDDVIRPNATIFVGTLPELEMSLYTICFYARPNDLCPVSLSGAKFNIFTHPFRYGKDLIDLAVPIF